MVNNNEPSKNSRGYDFDKEIEDFTKVSDNDPVFLIAKGLNMAFKPGSDVIPRVLKADDIIQGLALHAATSLHVLGKETNMPEWKRQAMGVKFQLLFAMFFKDQEENDRLR